jgi:hypothetical protein
MAVPNLVVFSLLIYGIMVHMVLHKKFNSIGLESSKSKQVRV